MAAPPSDTAELATERLPSERARLVELVREADSVVALTGAGKLDGVVTQNVDMLHRKAGARELVEVHGSIASCPCPTCATQVALEQAQVALAADPDGVPRCPVCAAALKPDVVLFGELLPLADVRLHGDVVAELEALLDGLAIAPAG